MLLAQLSIGSNSGNAFVFIYRKRGANRADDKNA
jgi:hypothetical protein